MSEPTLTMWDASNLPDPQPVVPVGAFYLGGDTPHVYTDAQVAAIRARWGLPIWTGFDHQSDGQLEAEKVVAWLRAHHWKPGTLVGLDTEDLVIPGFIGPFNAVVTAAGWLVLHYESKSSDGGNPPTSGGRWSADWTGIPHLRPGDRATQYVPGAWLNQPYDLSLMLASAPLHELNPPVTHRQAWVNVAMTLPVLGVNDTGPAVARMQHLLDAWYPGSIGPTGPDGVFGPATLGGLLSFQRAMGLQPPPGACDGRTWQLLTEG